MPVLALALLAIWFLVAVVLRAVLQRRATGDSGLRLGSRRTWVEKLLAVSLVVGIAAPVLAVLGIDSPADGDAARVLSLAGAVVALTGIGLTFWAQWAMGDSWRIGVDESERTDLVVAGPFRHVRNPIFTSMAVTVVGLALTSFNVTAVLAVALVLASLEVQVRVVEEPYLRATHGPSYVRYLRTTGRFLPGIGLMR